MEKIKFFALLGSLAVISGCATIIDGSTETVAFNSTPNGAEIFVNGSSIGHTPITTRISKKSDTIIEARLEGYSPAVVSPSRSIDTTFFFNAPFMLTYSLGATGSTIDVATNSAYSFDQNQFFFNLQPERQPRESALSVQQGN